VCAWGFKGKAGANCLAPLFFANALLWGLPSPVVVRGLIAVLL